MRKKICIIDGQGGGIGTTLVKYLKAAFGEDVELIALGTNSIATSRMLKAGANKGASGEAAVCRSAPQADLIQPHKTPDSCLEMQRLSRRQCV